MDRNFVQILTGCDMQAGDPIKDAVAARFAVLRPALVERRNEDRCYDGNRCLPENLGWRFQQNYGTPTPESIQAGACDEAIEATWHEAASAEHWYRYEKDWG